MLIAVQNQATVVTDDQVALMTRAAAYQLRYHAAPAWERHVVPVVFYPKGVTPPPGSQLVVMLDTADQAGALGYHDETPDGQQYSRVFAKTTMDNGGEATMGALSVSSVLSHEVLEMFVDPTCMGWEDNGSGKLYAREVGDPVESDSYGVKLRPGGTVEVSNFVYPAWFDAQAPKGAQLDHMGKAPGPFKMTAGGYVIVANETGVTQQYGAEYPAWKRPGKLAPASRTSRLVAARTAGL